ncbi:hypothetical protein VST63_15355 [Mycolicibacterium sp. 050232]|uniref:hypothetical protein n=1 Tax=Mycolicibacterium sp. 050232 TaxID=3113982 RepID=UPI002E2CED1F|nr:hypothetical protein [Mycolicibacterium sp. 050232]MED5813736.1 hypothetical protein [Mycolicibacterium sp. 050232]
MAVRPLVTTGVALLSAGALVAGTPSLFVPRDEITVAASTAEAPAQRTLTAEQIQLVALSLEGALAAFNDGYGGYYYQGYLPAPTPGYVLKDGELVYPPEGTPENTPLLGPDEKPLYKDAAGTIPATVGDMGDNVQFYDAAGNKVNENFYAPGNCSATGAVCHDGFTGLAYYLSDNILPVDIFDNIFFEAGATEFAYLGSVVAAAAVDAFDPTQKLQLSKRVDEFFSGGASLVAYSVINDNLPDDAVGEWVKGLNYSFFDGGVTAVVDYVVETVKALTSPPESEDDATGASLLAAVEKTEADTETESSVTSTTLPNVSKLLSLPTPKLDIETPFKKLADQLKAPAESKVISNLDVKEEAAADDAVVDGATDSVAPAVEVSKPTTPTFELPKLPKLDLDLTPKVETTEVKEVKEVKEPAAEEKSDEAATTDSGTSSGAAAGASNKFAPKSRATERRKTAGEKFVEKAAKNLEKAFKPTTKAGASKQEAAKGGAAKNDADSASGAKTGNAHSGTNDNKSTKDSKDK